MTMGTWDAYRRGLAAYNAGDLDAYLREFAEDAVLQRPDGDATGRAAIRGVWDRELRTFPDRFLVVLASAVQDGVVAVEWLWKGTNTGPVHAPDGRLLPATGRHVELRGMEIAQFRGEVIVAYRMYWDHRQVQRQLAGASSA